MEDKLTIDQFAEKIKTKYPAYKDMDNGELTQKIIDKYPVYKDQVDFEKKNQDETLDSSLEETSMDVTKESGDGIQESSSKDEPIAQDVAQDEGVLDRVKNYFLNSVNEYEAGVKERSSDRSNYKSSFSNMTDDERGKASLSTLMTDALYNTVTNVLPSEIQTTVEFSPLSDELDRINEGIAKAKKNNEDSVTIESAPPVIGLTGPNTNLKNEPSKKYSLEDAYKKRTEIQKKANESYVSIKKKLNDSEEMSLASDGSYSEMFTAQGLINLVATQAPRLGVSVVAPVIGSYAQIYGNTYIDNLTAIAAKENGVDERNVTPKMIVDQIDTGNDGKEVSMIASGIGASLDMIGLGAMTNRIKAPLVGFIRQHVKKGLQKGGKAGAKKAISVASDLLTGANVLKGSAIEGGTETAQSVIQQVSKGLALDKTLKESFNSVDWHSSFKEGIAGAIMGGPVSGVTGRLKLTSQDVEAMIANYDVGGLTQFTEDGFIDWNTIPQRTKDKVKFLEKVKGEKIPYDLNEEELTKSKNEKYVEEKLGIKPKVEVDVKKDVDVEEQVEKETPKEIVSLKDDEDIVFSVENIEDVPPEYRDRVKESSNITTTTREMVFGLPIGEKKVESKTNLYYTLSGKEVKDQYKQQLDEQTTADSQGVPSMDEGAESNVNQVDAEARPRAKESTDQQGEVVVKSTKGQLNVDEGGKAELTTEDGRIIELGNVEDGKTLEEVGLSFDQATVEPKGGTLYNVNGQEVRLREGEQFKNSKKGRSVTVYDNKNKPVKITGNQAEELEYFSKLNDGKGVDQTQDTNSEVFSESGTKKERITPPTTLKEAAESIYNTYSIVDPETNTSVAQGSQNIVNENTQEVTSETEGQGSVEIESNETPVTIDNKKETATAQKQESKSVTNRIARARETTKKLRQKYKDIKDYKKNLIDSVYGRLKDKELNNLSNFFHKSVMKRLNNASTFESVDRILNKAFHDIAANEIKRADAVISDIVKKSKKNVKTENGRRKGNRVDNLTRKIFDRLRSFIDSKESYESLNTKNDKNMSDLNGKSELEMEDAIAEGISRQLLMKLSKAEEAIRDAKELTADLKDKKKYSESQRSDYNNRTLSLEQALRLKESVIDDMMKIIDGGKSNLKEEVAKEAYRLKDIVENAIADTDHEGSMPEKDVKDKKAERNAFQKAFYAAISGFNRIARNPVLSSFEFMTKVISNNSEIDNGYLRQKFYVGEEGYAKALENKRAESLENKERFIEKLVEIFNIKNSNKARSEWMAKSNEMDKNSGVVTIEEGQPVNQYLSKAQALTVYLYSKMNGIKGNLEAAGYTPESIKQVEEFLGEDYIALGDYMASTLEEKYKGYNEVYREIYRTEMEKVDNYFPVEYQKEDIKTSVDVGVKDNQKASSTPGSSISRVANNNKINDRNSAVDLFDKHLEEISHFKHTARVNKDINAILSNTKFIQNVKTLTENGEMLEMLVNATKSISLPKNKQTVDTDQTGRIAYAIQKGVQLSYVGLKLWTAAKQTISAIAVLAEADNVRFGLGAKKRYIPYLSEAFGMGKMVGRMAKGIPMMYKSHKFMYENSVAYKERIDSRDAGSESIRRVFEDTDIKYLDAARAKAARITLLPNTIVDAMTIAWSGKALYDQNLAKYKGEGVKNAEKKALKDFELYFQLSQQSSNPELLSSVQRDKGWAGSLAAFKNSQFAYFRKVSGSVYSLTNSYTNEKARLKKLGYKDAGKKAMKKVLTSEEDIKNMKQFFVFGYALPMAWQYVLSGLPGILTKYDDEEDDYDMMAAAALGPVDGLYLAKDVMKFGLDTSVGGKKFKYQPSILVQEINEMVNDYAQAEGLDETPLLAVKYAVKFYGGVDLDGSMKIYEAIEDIINKNGNASYENILKLMNAPKSVVGEEEEESSLEFMDDNRDFSEGEFMDDNREFSDN